MTYGYSGNDRSGPGGFGTGAGGGIDPNSGTNQGRSAGTSNAGYSGGGPTSGPSTSSSGFSGGGTQSGPGGNQSKSGSAPSGKSGGSSDSRSASGREGTGGGPGGPAGTGRNSGTNASGGGGTASSPTSYAGVGAGLSAPGRTAGAVGGGFGTATGFTPDFGVRRSISGADMASRIGPTINSPPSVRDIVDRTAFNVAQANAADLAASTGYRPGTPVAPAATPTGFAPTFPARIGVTSTNSFVERYLAPTMTRLANPAAATRMGNITYDQPSDALNPGYIGAGLSAAPSPTAAASVTALPVGSSVAPNFAPDMSRLTNPVTSGPPAGFGPAIAQPTGFTPAPAPASSGPPAASLTNQTVAQGLATAPVQAVLEAGRTSDYNAQRAAVGQQARAIENASMNQYRTGVGAETLAMRDAIAQGETGGKKDPYSTKHPDVMYKGKVANAYGKYGIMDFNIPNWTKQALGKAMTPQEFLANPQAQDTTFDVIFGGYVREKGLEKAARSWLGGGGDPNAKDQVTGKTAGSYGKDFVSRYNAALERRTNEALNAPELGGTGPASPTSAAATRSPTEPASAREAGLVARDNAIAAAREQGQDPNSATVQSAATVAQREAERTWTPNNFPAAPAGPANAVTPPAAGNAATPATAAAGTSPTGLGAATGPWGVKPEGPIPGQKYPDEPMSPGQQTASFLFKLGLGTLGGLPGAAIAGLDLLDETFTGRGFIDDAFAMSDNPGMGGGSSAYQGGSGDRGNLRSTEGGLAQPATVKPGPVTTKTTTAAPKPTTFEATYLDDAKYPTPHEKWGNASTYGTREYG